MNDTDKYSYKGFEIEVMVNPHPDPNKSMMHHYKVFKDGNKVDSGLINKQMMEDSAIDWRDILISRLK